MTRPRKQTVDWFPHSCNHGRTIYILEKRFDIAGYYFWFRLLELLGNTEGHFIDAEDPAAFEYLQAHTHTTKETCLEILDLLATLEAIDPTLWKDKLIWSDNFVIGVAAAYRNRNIGIPTKPENYRQKSGVSGKTTNRKPQMRVEEGDEMRVEEGEKIIAPPGPLDTGGALMFFSCQFFEVDFDYRLKLAKEFPAIPDQILLEEFSKMEDWIIDNKRTKKFKANGHLANPRLFIKNWLKRVQVDGSALFGKEPKGFAALRESARRRQSVD
jgi:hypothetical protein